MGWPIKSVPENCFDPKLRGDMTYWECYCSQVDENNCFHGYTGCYESQCLALDVDRLTESERRQLKL